MIEYPFYWKLHFQVRLSVESVKRKGLGVSQEELVINAGVECSNMGKIERGENNFSVLNLIRIADALDSKVAEMLADA